MMRRTWPFWNKLQGTPLPLKIGKKRVAQNVATGAQQILKGDFKSKFLRLFRGTQRQNLALLEFYDVHDAAATGAGPVLVNLRRRYAGDGATESWLGNAAAHEFLSQRVFEQPRSGNESFPPGCRNW
jgi:hypothetical protein